MAHDLNIKTIREALGLTQSELGERLGGLHQGSVSRLERGQTKPRGLVLAALKDLQREAEARAPEGEAA
jgi:transcriptional regulator with XRE-family HTH domain